MTATSIAMGMDVKKKKKNASRVERKSDSICITNLYYASQHAS